MSTDGSTHPTEPGSTGHVPTAGATSVSTPEVTSAPGTDGTASYGTTSEGTIGDGTTGDGTTGETSGSGEPGWVSRNTNLLISALLVVIVAALAIAAVVLYRNQRDDSNADTEAAVTQFLSGQNLQVETIDCSGDTCAVIVGGQAATVLVQEDDKGDQHFGVSAYSGN
jgi:membrane protein implicated in regulation of membrane protease activity